MSSPAQALPAASLIQLIWLASPALPVGGFSYSEGFESAVERAGVQTESATANWLADQLQLTLERGELATIAQAIPAWRDGDISRIRQLNDWLLQTRESSEMRAQTEQMGRSLLEWLRNHEGANAQHIQACSQLPPTYPIAFALAASQTEAGVHHCLLAKPLAGLKTWFRRPSNRCRLGRVPGSASSPD